jgi:hypothetical protein
LKKEAVPANLIAYDMETEGKCSEGHVGEIHSAVKRLGYCTKAVCLAFILLWLMTVVSCILSAQAQVQVVLASSDDVVPACSPLGVPVATMTPDVLVAQPSAAVLPLLSPEVALATYQRHSAR